ncbi:MAG: DUF3368 domain-containing protein [Saprospiraceae bacterium]
MVVICDTGPLSGLIQIGRLSLLKDLFQEIILPESVFLEVEKLEQFGISIDEIRAAEWIRIETPRPSVLHKELAGKLDIGEIDAIVLAIQEQADRLLIDERAGRKVAEEYGIGIIGTVGCLRDAKKAKLITNVKTELDKLIETGHWISPKLYNIVLKQANEL